MATRRPSHAELRYESLADAIHRGVLQYERLIKLDTPLGADVLVPLRAQGRATLGRDYRWIVDVASTRDDIALLSLMHQPVTLWLQQSATRLAGSTYRPIHGFVHRVGVLGADGELTVYQLEFSSALYFLGPTRNDHYWLEQDAGTILLDVFNRYPALRGRVRLNVMGKPRVRSYCRQAESDLNFVHRILEDEGWYGYWKHEETREGEAPKTTLVIVDRSGSLPEARPVVYYRGNAGDEVDGLTQWAAVQTLQSLRYTTRSFDYKQPVHDREAASELESTTFEAGTRRRSETRRIPAVPMEVFEALPYGYADTDAGYAQARLRTQAWDAAACRYRGVGGLRWLDAGASFVLDGHARHTDREPGKRTFVAIEAHWFIENNIPTGELAAALAHSLQRTLAEAKALHGARFVSPPHGVDGGTGFFVVEFEAQARTVEYRSPFEHRKPTMQIEHARVVAPAGEEAWADALNRIRVRHTWDRQNTGDGFATSPLLLSLQADTGNAYGAVHVPRAGEWVAIGHWGGDCDRPFVLGRLNGGATEPPWHTNVLLSGFQSRGFGDTGAYNAFVHDDATNQGATRLTSFTGQRYSIFHQGYLIRQNGNTRGRYLGMGFVLHTDDYGAIRANRGLYVSTHAQAYDGEQLDVEALHGQLDRAGMLVEALSHASATAQAESLQAAQDALEALKAATRHVESGGTRGGRTDGGGTGEANGFASPVIAMASPADIGLSTQQSAQLTADRQVNVVSGENAHVAAGKSLIVAAVEKISVFVQKAGMKLLAAKGKVELAAQSDEMLLYADQDVRMTSRAGRVEIQAHKELILRCGRSWLRITDAGIEDGTPGVRRIKSASLDHQGPESVAEHLNTLPRTAFNDPYLLRNRITGKVIENGPYEILRVDGTRIRGVTNELGQTGEQKNHDIELVKVRVLRSDESGA